MTKIYAGYRTAGALSLFLIASFALAGCGGGGNSASPAPAPVATVVATPVSTPAAGAYTSAQSVTLTDATAGATIYYTTNGTTPTTASTAYTAPIAVGATTTIQAIAAEAGDTTSAVSTAAYTINLPGTAAPVFSPAGGTFGSAQTVTVTDATAGATIYYTTNGTLPTASSSVYSAPLTISSTTTLEAIALAPNDSASAVTSAVYTINVPAAAPTFTPAAGTYASAQSVTLADATTGAAIYYTTNGTSPTTASTLYTGPIAISATTTIEAIAVTTGSSASPVSSAVYTISVPAAAPTFTPAAGTYTSVQSVTLADTTPGATIYYTTTGATPTTSSQVYSGPISVSSNQTINAIASAPNFTPSTVATAAYTINLSAATPTFTPAAGTYTSSQSVALADATSGATIYYTTDGTTPTTASKVYSAPITVAASTQINAIATATGYITSAEGAAFYEIQFPTVSTPAISPAGGTFTASQQVTLTDSNSAASIYYTTNGSTPTTSSTLYTAPFTISAPGTTVVNAIAFLSGNPMSAVAMASFTLPAGTAPIYIYTNVQIVGGGFVDGLFFHPASKGLMYARTDVGGAYRFNNVTGGDTKWVPLTDFIGRFDYGENLGVESLGLDPNDATRVYLAVGEYSESYGNDGYFLSSSDQGATFTAVALPFKNGANDNGRFAGERISVDPANGRHIYLGTYDNGLYQSNDQGATFQPVAGFPVTGVTGTTADPGAGVIFEDFLTTSGMAAGNTKTIYYGISDPKVGLYVSNDGGQTFTAVPGQPTGYYPNSNTFDPGSRYLYISYGLETGCTSGCSSIGPQGVNAGQVWRYTLPTSQVPNGVWTNITPPTTGNGGYGYSSVTVDAEAPDTVMTTTLNKYYPPPYDDVFRSLDDGTTWVNYGTNISRNGSLSPWINFGAATPDGGNWLNHPVIDPFNSNHVMYGCGQTIWQTMDATAVNVGVSPSTTAVTPGAATNWTIGAVGIEETVVLTLASPPSGPAHLLSGVGDIGSFTHTTLTASVNSQQNPLFSNGVSIDYGGQAPLNVARVGVTSSATQKESYSSDGGLTWTPSASVPVNPTTNLPITTGQGTIAVAADGSNLVWAPADVGTPANYSTDHGATWHTAAGAPAQVSSNPYTVAADRVNHLKFYLFQSSNGTATVYISTNGGQSFVLASQLTNQNDTGFFVSPAAEGDIWATSSTGLNHSTNSGTTFSAVLSPSSSTTALGFGMAGPGATYPALYMIGQLSGDSACISSTNATSAFSQPSECIYRSLDDGQTFIRVNGYTQQFGNPGIIVGDPRVFGRFYLGTNGRGIVEGDSPN